jgi:outer membrane protein OmpA-like peptidoglycan-associated protein
MARYRLIGVSGVVLLMILMVGSVSAQAQTSQPPDTVPAGAKREILNLKYPVEDLGGKVQSLQMKETATEIRIELAADVLFDFDKFTLLPKAQGALKQVAGVIGEKAKGVVQIEGHTDSKGSDSYNERLSDRRANAVKDWLINKEGLKNVKFETRGFGSRKPVSPNTKPDGSDNPEGRQKNRRVEIILKK